MVFNQTTAYSVCTLDTTLFKVSSYYEGCCRLSPWTHNKSILYHRFHVI